MKSQEDTRGMKKIGSKLSEPSEANKARKKMASKMVSVSGQMVREGSKKHSRLMTQLKQGADLSHWENK